jgi:hypothetical protein
MPDALQQGASGYAVGWFSLSLINAGLAQGKGRSGLKWWLASIFLGPFATFLIVILPPPDLDPEAPQGALSPILIVVLAAVVLLALGLLAFVRFGS